MQAQNLLFQTARLRVENWRDLEPKAEDLKALATMLTPKVTAHLPPDLQLEYCGGDAQKWFRARRAESDVLPIFLHETDELAGLGLLVEFDGAPTQLHIGFLFGENHWGQSFASEWLEGLVNWQREAGTRKQLKAGASADNLASIRVLEKLGFARVTSDAPDTITFSIEI